MAVFPPLDENVLIQVCNVLGDTGSGLTGSEIGTQLQRAGIPDVEPGITKRRRLFSALAAQQAQDKCANSVLGFIKSVMTPVAYVGAPEHFDQKRGELNRVLLFTGLELRDDGELIRAVKARTIEESEQRAGRLRNELRRRMVHTDVLKFCRQELLQNNYFHAVFEATKSVADKIRNLSGLTEDGAELVDRAFGVGKDGLPYLAFNSLQSETHLSEHRGFMHLIKGIFGAFRNVTAHAPKITWVISEADALDLMSIASLIHRRLDAVVRTSKV